MKRLGVLLLMMVMVVHLNAQPVHAYEDVPNWFSEGLITAKQYYLVPDQLEKGSMNQPITRGEFAEIMVRAYVATGGTVDFDQKLLPFEDTLEPYVVMARTLGLVTGYEDNTFDPDGFVHREAIFVMLQRLMQPNHYKTESTVTDTEVLDHFTDTTDISVWAMEAAIMVVGSGIVSGTTKTTLAPKGLATRAQGLAIVNNGLKHMIGELEQDSLVQETLDRIADLDVMRLSVSSQRLFALGNNKDKRQLLFNSDEMVPFDTPADAIAQLEEVVFDAWMIDGGGEKITVQRKVTVHNKIAPFIQAVFQEIYEGDEQFPIKMLHGYAWRQSPTSEHRWGLAIDINYDENYMITSKGVVVAGSHWSPGENPYSILPDGDVVRAFRKYGFTWGGNAWHTGNDYMHFSYLGR